MKTSPTVDTAHSSAFQRSLFFLQNKDTEYDMLHYSFFGFIYILKILFENWNP
jgi:hypothetical protein